MPVPFWRSWSGRTDFQNVANPLMLRTKLRRLLFVTTWLAALSGVVAAGLEPETSRIPDPEVRAKAAIIYNPTTGKVLWQENSQGQLSIASLTKVMTTIVFMEQHPDLTREAVISINDVRRASITYIRSKERVVVRDLLHLALIASDNAAARALARISPWGTAGFIERMNEKAKELGLWNTRFTDPSGLDGGNVSSAYDMSRLIAYVSNNKQICEIMRKESYQIRTNRRRVTVRSTNKLLGGNLDVRAGKTGYIRKAGFCLAALLHLPEIDRVAVVVLGAQSNAGRFREAKKLVDWLTTEGKSIIQN